MYLTCQRLTVITYLHRSNPNHPSNPSTPVYPYFLRCCVESEGLRERQAGDDEDLCIGEQERQLRGRGGYSLLCQKTSWEQKLNLTIALFINHKRFKKSVSWHNQRILSIWNLKKNSMSNAWMTDYTKTSKVKGLILLKLSVVP